jgi:hypothetical protein
VISDGIESSLNRNERSGINIFRLDLLPFLRSGVQTHQFCSYDRAGDDYDFDYFALYMEPDGECVILDAFGPGCLIRHQMKIWHDNQIYKGVRICYVFDDEPTPRVDMDVSQFFSQDNPLGIFQSPLAFDGKDRFRILYDPMFFRNRLRVCLCPQPGGGPATVAQPWIGRSNLFPIHRYHCYNYTYGLYSEDPGLTSWTPTAGRHMMPALLEALNRSGLDSEPKSSQGVEQRSVNRTIGVGQTATLWDKSGVAGSISVLHIKINAANREDAVVNTWLKINFDQSTTDFEVPEKYTKGKSKITVRIEFVSSKTGRWNEYRYWIFSYGEPFPIERPDCRFHKAIKFDAETCQRIVAEALGSFMRTQSDGVES